MRGKEGGREDGNETVHCGGQFRLRQVQCELLVRQVGDVGWRIRVCLGSSSGFRVTCLGKYLKL